MMPNILAVVFMLGVFWGFSVAWAADTPTEITQDEQLTWMQDAFNKHITDMSSDGVKVRFQTDGFFVKEETELKKEFSLAVNETMMHPDHHGMVLLRVQSMDAEGVTLAYESTFDHRSFGPDKITKDEGQFKIFWRKSDGPA